MSSLYLDHILSRLRNDVAFLQSQNHLSPQDADLILSRLPPSGADRGVDDVANSFSNLSIPEPVRAPSAGPRKPVPPPKPASLPRARALWNYSSEDPADLDFQEDDVIEIVEEVNEDWWKGRVGGRTGLFPANYVEKLPAAASPPPPTYTAPMRNGYRNAEPKVAYVPPSGVPPSKGLGSPYPYQQPQYQQYPPPPPPQQQQYPPPPPPQQYQPPMVPQAPAPAPAPAPTPSRFGNLGNTMANAAAGGLGWGAGAAIGSDLINSIF